MHVRVDCGCGQKPEKVCVRAHFLCEGSDGGGDGRQGQRLSGRSENQADSRVCFGGAGPTLG